MPTRRLVLLADSELDRLNSLGLALRGRGYQVLTARDGDHTAELLDRWLPDLIVANLLLPGRSGLAIARLAKDRSEGRLPVVLLSSLTGPAHRDYALALGVEHYLLHPTPGAVLAVVEAVCPPTVPALANPLLARSA